MVLESLEICHAILPHSLTLMTNFKNWVLRKQMRENKWNSPTVAIKMVGIIFEYVNKKC